MELYPLGQKHAEIIKSKSGKKLNDITIKNIKAKEVTSEDIKVSKEVLILQAEVARQQGNNQMAQNFIRASELVDVPDDEILNIYNMLRPYRATKSELVAVAKKLKEQYKAELNVRLIEETIEVYEQRDLFKK